MALNVKILGLSAVLGGGGIAIPLYLKSGGKGPVVNAQAPAQAQEPIRSSTVTTSRVARSTESIEKVSCKVSNSSLAPKDMADYVSGKGNQTELYSFVSCTNPTVKGSEDSYLGKKWDGLFPTTMLSGNLSYKGGEKFEIKATVDKEEDNWGNSVPVMTFSNPSTQDSIKGKWTFEGTSFQKQAITVSIEGIKERPKKVYLFIDSSDQKTVDQAQ